MTPQRTCRNRRNRRCWECLQCLQCLEWEWWEGWSGVGGGVVRARRGYSRCPGSRRRGSTRLGRGEKRRGEEHRERGERRVEGEVVKQSRAGKVKGVRRDGATRRVRDPMSTLVLPPWRAERTPRIASIPVRRHTHQRNTIDTLHATAGVLSCSSHCRECRRAGSK